MFSPMDLTFQNTASPPAWEKDRIELRQLNSDPGRVPEGTIGVVTDCKKKWRKGGMTEYRLTVLWATGEETTIMWPKDVIRRLHPFEGLPRN